MTNTWLITGCSTGFGRLIARAALERGDQVVATARDPASLSDLGKAFPETARAIALDVTRPGDADRAVALANETFGGVDILVNNAGFGFIGTIEEATPEEYRPMFEANVFGLIETTRAALPSLRRKRGSRVVNMSSGAGIKGMQGSGYYNATKFAVEGLSEALAQEVAPFGMSVIIVEPGPFRTDFLGRSMATAKRELPEYAATAGVFRAYRADNDGKQVGDPDKAIKVMFKAIDSDNPRCIFRSVRGLMRCRAPRSRSSRGTSMPGRPRPSRRISTPDESSIGFAARTGRRRTGCRSPATRIDDGLSDGRT